MTEGRRDNHEIHERLDKLADTINAHIKQETKDREVFIELINANTEMTKTHMQRTADLMDVWDATNGAIKVGKNAGKFVAWVSGFVFIGSMINYFTGHFK